MGIYLGQSDKLKLSVNNNICHVIIPSPMPITEGIVLMSADNYILKDLNGIYLTVKEDE